MRMVENPVSFTAKSVAASLGVPKPVEIDIIGIKEDEETDSDESDYDPSDPAIRQHNCEEVGNYWRNTVPGANWEMMAHALYQNNEQRALEGVKKYLTEFNVIKGRLSYFKYIFDLCCY